MLNFGLDQSFEMRNICSIYFFDHSPFFAYPFAFQSFETNWNERELRCAREYDRVRQYYFKGCVLLYIWVKLVLLRFDCSSKFSDGVRSKLPRRELRELHHPTNLILSLIINLPFRWNYNSLIHKLYKLSSTSIYLIENLIIVLGLFFLEFWMK